MRCPYCGGINPDQITYCVRCGRDLSQQAGRPRSPQVRQGSPVQPRPVTPPPPPYQAPRPPLPATSPGNKQRPPQPVPGPQSRPAPLAAPPAPDAPAPYPPRTVAQLKALEQGALAYTVLNETAMVGAKKIVRIVFPRCTAWQQVATLLKALTQLQGAALATIVIQGVTDQTVGDGFTNGQLQFDRNVRLGSQIQDRYIIETGNGFDSNSVRIVLSE